MNLDKTATVPSSASGDEPFLMAVAVSSFGSENTIDFRRLINCLKPLLYKG
jgi:hypothetical protein